MREHARPKEVHDFCPEMRYSPGTEPQDTAGNAMSVPVRL